MLSLKLKLIHHASIHPIHFGEFSSSPMYGQISRNDAFRRCGCLPWTWLGRFVKFIGIWIFEPSENQCRAANGIWGVRYLAWRLVFVLDFDNWSMGAKPWTTSGGQPVVFGLSGNPKPRKVINPAQFKQTCLGSLMVNGRTLWVMYQGFMHLDTETRAAELHWSFLFLVNLAPLCFASDTCILPSDDRFWGNQWISMGSGLAVGFRGCAPLWDEGLRTRLWILQVSLVEIVEPFQESSNWWCSRLLHSVVLSRAFPLLHGSKEALHQVESWG